MDRYAAVPIDAEVDLNDSRLPSDMIWAGGEAIDELRADKSLDLDSCALAVGVYRAMVGAMPSVSFDPDESVLFAALALVKRFGSPETPLADRICARVLERLVIEAITGRSPVEDAVRAYRERVLQAIQSVRHLAATDFKPGGGQEAEWRCDSLLEAYRAVEGLEL